MMQNNPKAGFIPLALESAARGILIPIMSLMLLEKGFHLASLPFGIAVCSTTILIFELPSGIWSDRIGRRRIFLAAQAVYMLALLLFLVSKTPFLSLAALALYGLARALSSGSIDALTADACLAAYGKSYLPTLSALTIASRAGGLAVGSLIGGLIHWAGTAASNGSSAAILTALGVTLAAWLSAVRFTRESESLVLTAAGSKHRQPFFIGLRSSLSCFTVTSEIPLLMTASSWTGVLAALVETYWQPRFSMILHRESLMWLLGLLGFGYFGVSILGSLLAKQLSGHIHQNRLFPAGYLLAGACLLLLGLTAHPASFFTLYLLLYLFIGVGDSALSVSIHHNVPSAFRATLLSGQSLIFQLGGLAGSIAAGLLVDRLTIPGLWVMGAVPYLAAILMIGLRLRYEKRPPK